MKPVHVLFVLLVDCIWAVNFVAIKEAVTLMAPLLSVALRYVALLFFCLPFLRFVKGRMKMLLFTAALTGALQFGLGAYSFHVASNLSALAIANQAGVPLSLILAILIDGERIAWRRTVGIALALLGVVIIVFDPRIIDERLGILLTIGAAFCWAAGNLLFRRLADVPVLTTYGWQAVVSIPLLFLASAIAEPGSIAALPAVPWQGYFWVIYSGIGSSLIGHAGLSWLLKTYPVSTITPLTLPTPLLTVLVATIVYGTPITTMMWVGGALTLAGVTIIALRSKRRVGAI